jgi:Xaa-Pro aminopeptidase
VSFPSISGAGPNGAIVHYRVTRATNRAIKPDELFLIDSGAQYEDGTTDITRTVAVGVPTAEMRDRFTRVLKGHIAIARAVFPTAHRRAARFLRAPASLERGPRLRSRHRPRRRQLSLGARRPGAHLQARHRGAEARHDPVERARLLQDRRLRHPHREPRAGVEARVEGAEKPLNAFETLTLAPIDARLIEPALMTSDEIAWLDAYHARVAETLCRSSTAETRAWLDAATRPLRG